MQFSETLYDVQLDQGHLLRWWSSDATDYAHNPMLKDKASQTSQQIVAIRKQNIYLCIVEEYLEHYHNHDEGCDGQEASE